MKMTLKKTFSAAAAILMCLNLIAQNYDNHYESWPLSQFHNSSGGGTVSADITNDLLTISMSGSMTTTTMILGDIVYINASPALPNQTIFLGDINTDYYVELNNGWISIGTNNSYSANISSVSATFTLNLTSYPPTIDETGLNFVREYSSRTALTGDLSTDKSDVSKVMMSTTFFDGTGRNVQSVAAKASPGEKDIIQFVEYDDFGRVLKDYLPYEANTATGTFRANALAAQDVFYDGLKGGSSGLYAHSETKYRTDPTNRVLETATPGSSWRMSVGNTISMSTGTNSGETIKRLTSDFAGVIAVANYSNEELSKNITDDENGDEVIEYLDFKGRTILKKAQITGATYAQTYYIYNDRDELAYVLQPEGVNQVSNWSTDLNSDDFRKNWMFCYEYDGRGRMTGKRVPGTAWTYMVYDHRDRLVLTQDGNQRGGELVEISSNTTVSSYTANTNYLVNSGTLTLSPGFHASQPFIATTNSSSLNQEWTFTKYDAFNRPVVTGIIQLDGDQAAVQSAVDSFYATGTEYETHGSGSLHGYTNNSYPQKHGDNSNITTDDLLTVTYYDDYDFTSVSTPTGAISNVRGLVTGGKTKVLGSTTWLTSTTWYDDRYRVLRTTNDNHLGGSDQTDLEYFNDVRTSVKKSTVAHTANSTTTTVVEDYTYDHAERLTQTTHKVGSQSTVTLNSSTYNAIGELTEKNIGNSAQSIDYAYNLRGWLTTINGGTTFDDGSDKFGMELIYDAASQYNGNIGEIKWKSTASGGDNNAKTYDFTYDGLSRLQSATYNQGLSQAGYYDVSGITYDANGNILTLTRKYNNNNGDLLDYDYNGNQLTTIGDSYSDSYGFSESGSNGKVANEYTYDSNGNMTKDANKEIGGISYNYLNLPEQVSMDNGDYVKYTYDAVGVKLTKESKSGSNITTTDYVGGFHYDNNALDFALHSEGRMLKNGSTWDYEYNLTDHLGNVRTTVNSSGTVVQRDDYYPFGGTFNSYTSGTENLYKYNGKEEQEETGLYDFGARMLDPWLARWQVIDPLADKFHPFSPYNYVLNNPLKFIDPDGKDVELIIGKPYTKNGKEHPYGHVALRIHGDGYDYVVDFGRYGDVWAFGAKGDGVMNLYSDGQKYLANEQRFRESVGFNLTTTAEEDQKVIEYYKNLAKEGEKYKTGAVPGGGGTAYKLQDDYYVFDNNCCTKSAEGLEQIGENHIGDEYDPRDLLENIESNFEEMGFTKRTEYLKGGGTKVTYERKEEEQEEEK